MAECGAYFDNLPSAPQGGGAKVDKDGTVWYPAGDCKYCTKPDGAGDCFEAIVPDGHKPSDLDPRVTPLSAFPRWPVEFAEVEHVGDTWTRVLRRRNYPTRPINRMWLESWEEMASTWIGRAEARANTPTRKAWVDRLKVDLMKYADKSTFPCLADCRPELQRIWLVANAAQYLARAWGDTDSPPLLQTKSPTESALQGVKIVVVILALIAGVYVAKTIHEVTR